MVNDVRQPAATGKRPGRHDRRLSPELRAPALSDREQRVMLAVAGGRRRLERVRDRDGVRYDAVGFGDLIGVGTPVVVRRLVTRGLLAWAGEGGDLEQKAVLA